MDASALRRRLGELADEIVSLVRIAQQRSPLWRGIVHEIRRSCGRPNCRCARGELHVSTQLADRSGPKLRNLSLEGDHLRLFTEMTEDYRRVRRARARLVQISREMLRMMDQLEEVRREQAMKRHGAKLPPPRLPP